MPPVKVRLTPELIRKLSEGLALDCRGRTSEIGGQARPRTSDLGPQTSATLSRRRFLGGAVVLVCAAPIYKLVTGCSSSPGAEAGAGADAAAVIDAGQAADAGADAGAQPPQIIDGWEVPAGTTLPAADFAVLAALMDALVPGTDAEPGATQCHAAWYVDQLLGAFGVTPPRIFAGGPYSGRHGGLNGFKDFIPLNRVETIRWKTYIEGSQGIAEREFNGPVTGVRQMYEEMFPALTKAAKLQFRQKFTLCDVDQRREVLAGFDLELRQMAYEHAVEGTYGDPVYGGNFELRGWKVIDYEGDRQPLGYTVRQMLHPEEGY